MVINNHDISDLFGKLLLRLTGTPFVDRGEKVLEAMAMVLLNEHSKDPNL
jgi:hypothetical protein